MSKAAENRWSKVINNRIRYLVVQRNFIRLLVPTDIEYHGPILLLLLRFKKILSTRTLGTYLKTLYNKLFKSLI